MEDVKVTARDVQIMSRQIHIQQQQHAKLLGRIAHVEAVNQQLVTEYAELKAELDALKKAT